MRSISRTRPTRERAATKATKISVDDESELPLTTANERETRVPSTDVLPRRFPRVFPVNYHNTVVLEGGSGCQRRVWLPVPRAVPVERRSFTDIRVAALSSRIWAVLIAVDEVDMSYRDSVAEKRVRHLSDVFRGLNSLHYVTVMREGLDIDF